MAKTQPKLSTSTKELIAQVEELRRINSVATTVLKKAEEDLKERMKEPYVTGVPFGTKFVREVDGQMYIRCRPTSFLLNSTLVADSLGSGKALICNLETGSTFFVVGSELVTRI